MFNEENAENDLKTQNKTNLQIENKTNLKTQNKTNLQIQKYGKWKQLSYCAHDTNSNTLFEIKN